MKKMIRNIFLILICLTGNKLLYANLTKIGRHHLYVPENTSSGSPLMVVVHGCMQNSDDIMKSSRWNKLAQKEGFVVLYPNQLSWRNPYNCWNWFSFFNQNRIGGEAWEIVQLINRVQTKYGLEDNPVYLAGISSGAATVSIMISCWPEKFSGALIHSGVSYGVSRNPIHALSVLKNGPDKNYPRWFACWPWDYQGKVIIAQGKMDEVVNSSHVDLLISDFLSQADRIVKSRISNLSSEKYSYDLTKYLDNGRLVGQIFMIDQMGHAWSGGTLMKFSDPLGPDITQIAWTFFIK